jgi:hypothetical protein
MSSIPQNHSDEKALIDCVQRFFSKHLKCYTNVVTVVANKI